MYRIDIVSQLEAEHLEQLPELVDAASAADDHEPLGEHKFLRMQRGDDLAAAVLAFDGHRLAGYAHTVTYGDADRRRASCEFVVHPCFRRRGIGRLLLSHAIMHAQSQLAGRLDLWAYNDSAASARISAQFGFNPVRQLLHLHRHVRAMPGVAPPAGAMLRSFQPGADDAAWLALNNRIFAGHPENGAWTLDDLHARMAQPWFEPADLLMLDLGGELAGFCWLKVEDRRADGRVGEVYVIGAAPEHRGRGFGRYLLAAGLGRLAARCVDVAAIYVDRSNTAAVGLYASTGFHHHHVDVCYTRALASAGQLAA